MARILNTLSSINKECCEKIYKHESQIKELKIEIENYKYKKTTELISEKKNFILSFNKKYQNKLNSLIAFNICVLVISLCFLFINSNADFIQNIVFPYFLITAILSIIEIMIFHIYKKVAINNFTTQKILFYENQITSLEKKIEDLKKEFKLVSNSKTFIKRNMFLQNHGKAIFVDFIKNNFKDDVFLINDFCTKFENQKIEIDHILLTPKGIFCIDIKHADKIYYPLTNSKWIYYNEDYPCEIDNPQEAIINKTKILEIVLGNLHLQITPLIILTHPDSGFLGESTYCKIITIDELPFFYKDKINRFTDEQILQLSKKILNINKK